MTTWKNSTRSVSGVIVLLLISIAPCSATNATPPTREPIVLNGYLTTRDFNGGVGYGMSDTGYSYSSALTYSSAPNSEFIRTLAFIAGVRGRALHGSFMHGHGFGHR